MQVRWSRKRSPGASSLAFWWVLCSTSTAWSQGNAPDLTGDLSLPVWGTEQSIQLAAFKGEILVLDFFAHWCVPCRPASRQVETEIRQYYASRGGNRHGLPVRVLGMNIEAAQPERTRKFIEDTGLITVLLDAGGKLHAQLGGQAIPYLVVLAPAFSDSGIVAWQVRQSKAGFPGAEPLRTLIDSIEPPALASNNQPAPDEVLPSSSSHTSFYGLFHPLQTGIDGEFEGARTSDIRLWDGTATVRLEAPGWDWKLSLGESLMELDYRPSLPRDIYSQPTEVEEYRTTVQTRLRIQSDPLAFLFSGGFYDGFNDYRSRWLDEFYRQRFSDDPGYREAEPRGHNVGAGLRWEIAPGALYLQGDAVYQADDVAPAYEKVIFQPLRRRRDSLHTTAGLLSLEAVVTRRLRLLQQLQITTTTERELRYSYQGSVNLALSEHWVMRGTGTWSTEEPLFDSWSANASLERDWNSQWFAGLFARYYEDSGQLNQSLPEANPSSPALKTVHAGATLRWQGRRSSLKLSAGPYLSRYDHGSQDEFSRLYRDRDWLLIQAAITHNF